MSSLGKVVELEWASIRPFAAQPRKYFDKAALRDLARSGRAEKAIVVLATAVADVFDVSKPEFEAAILRRNASERESLMYRIQNAIDQLTQLKRMMIKKAA